MKTTVLQLHKVEKVECGYAIIPDLTGRRNERSIDFIKDEYSLALLNRDDMPYVGVFNEAADQWEIAIEFYKRVHNQYYGKSHATGKCIYGILSHPLYKKVKKAEFTLFESEVDFDDLLENSLMLTT